jgi:hypothetical protein
MEKFAATFNFKEGGRLSSFRPPAGTPAAVTFPAEGLIFSQGEFRHKLKTYPVERLIVETRRILITMVAPSKVADAFYESAASIISEFDADKQFDMKGDLLKSEETGCDITLDTDIRQLLSPDFANFLESGALPILGTKSWKPRLRGIRLALDVSYDVTDEKLSTHNINLAPKTIMIQSAPGSPLDQRRYMTFSPTDSDNHMAMLQEIDKLGSNSRTQNRTKK